MLVQQWRESYIYIYISLSIDCILVDNWSGHNAVLEGNMTCASQQYFVGLEGSRKGRPSGRQQWGEQTGWKQLHIYRQKLFENWQLESVKLLKPIRRQDNAERLAATVLALPFLGLPCPGQDVWEEVLTAVLFRRISCFIVCLILSTPPSEVN